MQQAAREKSKVEQEVQSQRAMYKILSQKYDEDVGNLDTQLRQVQSSLSQSAAEIEHQRAECTELARQLDVANSRNDSLTIGISHVLQVYCHYCAYEFMMVFTSLFRLYLINICIKNINRC